MNIYKFNLFFNLLVERRILGKCTAWFVSLCFDFTGSFYLGTMILTCMSIVTSVIVTNVSIRGVRRKPLPAWIHAVSSVNVSHEILLVVNEKKKSWFTLFGLLCRFFLGDEACVVWYAWGIMDLSITFMLLRSKLRIKACRMLKMLVSNFCPTLKKETGTELWFKSASILSTLLAKWRLTSPTRTSTRSGKSLAEWLTGVCFWHFLLSTFLQPHLCYKILL